MRYTIKLATLVSLAAVVGCGSDKIIDCCHLDQPGVRIVNAFTTPVDVLIDGTVAIAALPAGSVGTAAPDLGNHELMLRPTGGSASTTQSITTATGALNTIAVVRAPSGAVTTAVLDDTGSVVPAGATKVRVLHLAPNTGVLQVYRTQPDYQQPISWQFPFTYQSQPDALSAPFYQSTVGSWEIRVWKTPADASGWSTTNIRTVIPLKSGEKKTVLILDDPAGGVRLELI